MNTTIDQSIRKSSFFQSENRRSYMGKCPVCGRDKKFALDKKSLAGICYSGKCGIKSRGAKSLELVLGISKDEAQKMLGEQSYAAELPHLTLKFKDEAHSANELTNADFEEVVAAPVQPLRKFRLDHLCVPAHESQEALAFLAKRGVTDIGKIQSFNLYHHPVMKGVIAPIHMGVNEEMVTDGWQVRVYQPRQGGLKVISAPEMQKSRLLMNYNNAKTAKNVVLVEGIVDCLKATQEGFVGVASFGKAISTEQINLLKQLSAENIYIALDRDAFDIIDRIAAALSGKNVFRVLPPEHRGDIGDCTDEEVQEMYRNAVRLSGVKTARLELWLE